ncbi:MAG TPA: type II secretion system protein [Candidatus Paceibacterota bacterium]|nr:type II secretion system protein [Candidatus Paceibacterota bacterium]
MSKHLTIHRRAPRGYTLIELMVSMTIFALVMVIATAAYLSFIAYNRQAQATASVMNSVAYSIDSMTREIRSGTNYQIASNVITFTNADGCIVTYQLAAYSFDATINVINRSASQNSAGTCPAEEVTTASAITDAPTVAISNLRLFSRGSGNNYQPVVVIAINGYALIPNTGSSQTKVPFQVETTATQRLPQLPHS